MAEKTGNGGPNGHFTFASRTGTVDFRALSQLDVQSIEKNGTVFELQRVLQNIVYCNVSPEFISRVAESDLYRLIRALQLALEYGMHVQTAQQAVISAAESEIKSMREQLHDSDADINKLRAQLKGRKDALDTVGRLVQARSESAHASGTASQLLAGMATLASSSPGGPVKLVYRCALCPKVFRTAEFLTSHVTRRHPAAQDSVHAILHMMGQKGAAGSGDSAMESTSAALAARDAQIHELLASNKLLAKALSELQVQLMEVPQHASAATGALPSLPFALNDSRGPAGGSPSAARELEALRAEIAGLRQALQQQSTDALSRLRTKEARINSLTKDHGAQLESLQTSMRSLEESMLEQEASTAAVLASSGKPGITVPFRGLSTAVPLPTAKGAHRPPTGSQAGSLNTSRAGAVEDDTSGELLLPGDATLAGSVAPATSWLQLPSSTAHTQSNHPSYGVAAKAMVLQTELDLAQERIAELERALHAVVSVKQKQRVLTGLISDEDDDGQSAEEEGVPLHQEEAMILRAAKAALSARLPPSLMPTPAPPPRPPAVEEASESFVLSYVWRRLPEDASAWAGGKGYISMADAAANAAGETSGQLSALPPGTPQASMWASLLPCETQVQGHTQPVRVRIPGTWTLVLHLPQEGDVRNYIASALGVAASKVPDFVRTNVSRSTSVEQILSAVARRLGVSLSSLPMKLETRVTAISAEESGQVAVGDETVYLEPEVTVEEARMFQYRPTVVFPLPQPASMPAVTAVVAVSAAPVPPVEAGQPVEAQEPVQSTPTDASISDKPSPLPAKVVEPQPAVVPVAVHVSERTERRLSTPPAPAPELLAPAPGGVVVLDFASPTAAAPVLVPSVRKASVSEQQSVPAATESSAQPAVKQEQSVPAAIAPAGAVTKAMPVVPSQLVPVAEAAQVDSSSAHLLEPVPAPVPSTNTAGSRKATPQPPEAISGTDVLSAPPAAESVELDDAASTRSVRMGGESERVPPATSGRSTAPIPTTATTTAGELLEDDADSEVDEEGELPVPLPAPAVQVAAAGDTAATGAHSEEAVSPVFAGSALTLTPTRVSGPESTLVPLVEAAAAVQPARPVNPQAHTEKPAEPEPGPAPTQTESSSAAAPTQAQEVEVAAQPPPVDTSSKDQTQVPVPDCSQSPTLPVIPGPVVVQSSPAEAAAQATQQPSAPLSAAAPSPLTAPSPSPDIRRALDITMASVFGAFLRGEKVVLPGILAVAHTEESAEEKAAVQAVLEKAAAADDATGAARRPSVRGISVPPAPVTTSTAVAAGSMATGGGTGTPRPSISLPAGATPSATTVTTVSGGTSVLEAPAVEADSLASRHGESQGAPLAGDAGAATGGQSGTSVATLASNATLSPLNESVLEAADAYEAQALADLQQQQAAGRQGGPVRLPEAGAGAEDEEFDHEPENPPAARLQPRSSLSVSMDSSISSVPLNSS